MKASINLLIPFVSLLLFVYTVNADLKTKYPDQNTIWKTGEEYELTWFDSDKVSNLGKKWKNMRVDLMTGDNGNQKFLKNFGKNIDAKMVKSIKIKAPDVEPHAPVYFIMFSSPFGQKVWSTRFAIAGQDGVVAPAENAAQPDGKPIPWGVGKLVGESAKDTNDDKPPPQMNSKKDGNIQKENSAHSGSIKLEYPVYLMIISFVLSVLIQF
ncbi:hypothetical protein K501DRAFT_232421 [Backusella circina FSU 941]|nr:hypothetical protein K501DRAFT_232421 [Backusella circina FSU 941]